MAAEIDLWEHQLLAHAYVPLENYIRQTIDHSVSKVHCRRAYWQCEQITREHSRTFFLASSLMRADHRRAIRALYAFCRVSDDIVDRNDGDREADLQAWRLRSLGDQPNDDLVALAWIDTCARFHIPRQYAEQLLDGVSSDLIPRRYETFDDLTHYCYAVASTVGLMVMHIVGYAGKEAIPYAIKLGVALQITNILRDVGEDWRNGRLYLPLQELAAFGLADDDIAAGIVDERWRAFMRFQISRARRLFAEALPGVALLGKSGRFAIGAAAELYQAILTNIETNDYDVFNHRAYTSERQKLALLPRIWLRAQTGKYPLLQTEGNEGSIILRK